MQKEDRTHEEDSVPAEKDRCLWMNCLFLKLNVWKSSMYSSPSAEPWNKKIYHNKGVLWTRNKIL